MNKEKKFHGGFIIHSNKEEFEAKKRLMEAARREAEAVIAKNSISSEELKEQRAQAIANQMRRLEESTKQKETDDQSQR